MVRYETLKKFCKNDELRPAYKYVKQINGKWYATDGHAACRVDENTKHPDDILYGTDEFPSDCRYPSIERVMPDTIGEDVAHMNIREIQDKISKLRKVKKMIGVEEEIHYKECDCNDCYGGKVTLTESVRYKGHYYDLEEEVDCPVCHGHGVIPDIEDYDPIEDDYDPETDKTHIVNKWTGKMIPDMDAPVEVLGKKVRVRYLKLVLEVARDMETDNFKAKWMEDMLVIDVKGVMICIMVVI